MSQVGKRFFAFGCSYTNFGTITWADYIGINFSSYHNYGRGGASNTYIMNKLVEVDNYFKFNSETDLVFVMISGFGRFSWLMPDSSSVPQWQTPGDLNTWIVHNGDSERQDKVRPFVENMWNDDWAVYMSWIAVKTIKSILSAKNIEHKILMSIDNRDYLSRSSLLSLSDSSIVKANEIYELLDVKESVEEFRKANTQNLNGHPSEEIYAGFLCKHFPDLYTEKSQNLKDKPMYTFDLRNRLLS